MMSAATSILVLEIAILLLVIVGVLLFLEWKKRKALTQQLDQLLGAVEEQQQERVKTLTQYLETEYSLDASEAVESGEYMIEAEKQFMQQFIKQQVEKTTVAEFYENLCGLLDQYMYFVPKLSDLKGKVEPDVTPKPVEPVEVVKLKPKNVGHNNLHLTEKELEEKSEPEGEPDWGDAFSESGDEMDEDAKEGYDAEVKKG